jgi:two-component system alkaline phosphatase synthesis response regulator PhoP
METTDQNAPRLLIVDDDEMTRSGLLAYFQEAHYTVTSVGDVDGALDYLTRSPGYDVVLLDVALSGRSGLDLLREAKAQEIDSSFLILSARDDVDDRVAGLRLGADDYITKPFDVNEVEARVEAVLRTRPSPSADPSESFSTRNLEVNFGAHTCFRDGERVPLTTLEFEILAYLVKNRGRAIDREELRKEIWTDEPSVCLRTIDRHVAKIRRKLERDAQVPAYLRTVYGKGYEFMCEDAAA